VAIRWFKRRWRHSPSRCTGWRPALRSTSFAYIASRQFDRRVYGTVYAVALSAFSLTASVGPLLAAVYFDLSGGYNLFLLTAAFLVILATVLISLVPTQNACES